MKKKHFEYKGQMINYYNKVKNKNFTNENISKDICGFLEITKLFE